MHRSLGARAAGRGVPFALASLALAACAPVTQYRYTAFTPSARPIPWDGAVPEPGVIHAEGTLSHSDVLPRPVSEVHSTALNLAATTAEGSFGVGVVRGLDVGLRATYASWDWSQPSGAGTMPVPGRPALWGIGPEARAAITLDAEHHLSLGIAADALYYRLPWALWEAGSCGDFTCSWTPVRQGGDDALVFSAGVYPSWAFGDGGKLGSAFLMLGVHTDFKNDGFTDVLASGSTVQTNGMVPLAGGGASIHLGPARVGLALYAALSHQAGGAQQLGGAMVTLGWSGRPQ